MRFDEYWIGPAQLALTAELARSTDGLSGEVIEVGTWQGLSAIPIARAIAPAPLHVVDHWLGDAPEAGVYGIQKELVERDNYGIFLANAKDAGVTNIVVHKQGWREFIAEWEAPIRFVHIDASHTADEVSDNVAAFRPQAVNGAIFCGDDYGFPQVAEGVHRQFPEVNSSENKLWWTVVGSDEEPAEFAAHGHPLCWSRSYQTSLAAAREMFVVNHPGEAHNKLVMSGSNGTY